MILVKNRVGPSSIHGMGLFAGEFIPAGTAIWRFTEGFDQVFLGDQIERLPEIARQHVEWFGFFESATGNVILSGDNACFMNHSPTPNTGAPAGSGVPVITVALRDIHADEELTCDYFAFDARAADKLGASSLEG